MIRKIWVISLKNNPHMFKLIFLFALIVTPLFSFSQVKFKPASNASSKGNSLNRKLYPIRKGENYGYINKIGKIIIKPQFEDAKDFKDDFAIIKVSGKYGFINTSGIVIINPIYEDLQDFSEGLARIKVDGKYGFIDKNGKVLIKPQFENVGTFSDGLAEIKIAGKIGFINPKGEIISNPQFDEVSYFSEGLAKIKIDNKYGFINQKGEIVIKPKFSDAQQFSEGLALASIVSSWEALNSYGYIDKKGVFVISPQFGNSSGFFKEGIALASVETTNSQRKFTKFGYINKKGEFVIQPQFNSAFFFSEGLAWVSYSEDSGGFVLDPDAKWGCINKAGKFVINPQDYFWPGNFSEGLCYVMFKKVEGGLSKFCYIDRNGNVIIQPQFKVANDFHKGWASVNLNDDWGIINKSGEFFNGGMIDDIIKIKMGNSYGYMDKKGNWIWRPQ